jgi:hypothetical protein
VSEIEFNQIPIRVRWAGWESDTYVLKRQGWQIFAHQQMCPYEFAQEIMISAKAPDNRLMIMGRKKITPDRVYGGSRGLVEMLYHAGIEMTAYRSNDMVSIYEMPRTDWLAMDAMLPCDGFANVDLKSERQSFETLNLFKFTESPKEIYIPQTSVDDCLNKILQLQFPKQVELKKNAALVERPIIQAKIYSLAA